jgi:hypothetical protein
VYNEDEQSAATHVSKVYKVNLVMKVSAEQVQEYTAADNNPQNNKPSKVIY